MEEELVAQHKSNNTHTQQYADIRHRNRVFASEFF